MPASAESRASATSTIESKLVAEPQVAADTTSDVEPGGTQPMRFALLDPALIQQAAQLAFAAQPGEPEADRLALALANPGDGGETKSRRFQKVKLIRYDQALSFAGKQTLLKVRAPGKKKTLMSLELKF